MCLIGLALDLPGPWLLAVAANRDEFHDRHAAAATFWGREPDAILAGRDLQAGGTWLGVRRETGDASLRIAALTNLRPGLMPATMHPGIAQPAVPPSRGRLVAGFLSGALEPDAFLRDLEPPAGAYAGFNLLAMCLRPARAEADAWYLNNLPGSEPRRLERGIHVLSNATLDVAWPKTRRLRDSMARLFEQHCRVSPESKPSGEPAGPAGEAADLRLVEALIEALADRTPAPEAELPSTGLDRQRERLLSAPFIVDEHYGTRCSTALVVSRDGRVLFAERSFGPGGRLLGMVSERFDRERTDASSESPLPAGLAARAG